MPIYFVRKVFASQMPKWVERMVEKDEYDLYELQERSGMPLKEIEAIQNRIWRKNNWD